MHDFQPKFHVFGCLLVVLILGLLLVQFRGPRSRWLSLLGLGALFWGVYSECFVGVTFATSSYWNGNAYLRGGFFDADSNPDPETRIPEIQTCISRPWWNETMLLNAQLFGPPPGSYIGPYPDKAMASLMLATSGEPPKLRGQNQLVLSSGEVFEVYEITPKGLRLFVLLNPERDVYSVGLSNLHINRGEIWRVAYLSPISILTETDTAIELRLWRKGSVGLVWARWQK